MNFQSGSFTEFNHFKEVIKDWSLDFNILSKGDFKASFKLFTSDCFLLANEKLTGIIEHGGKSPIGYRTMVIPINQENDFVWYNKKVNGSDLLIFPKNNEIDVVTFDGLDIYLLSIEENLLFKTIEALNLTNCRSLFEDSEKEIFLSEAYALKFSKMAASFLNNTANCSENCKTESTVLIHSLLEYLETSSGKNHPLLKKSSSVALLKAVAIIKENKGGLLSAADLCEQVSISERSLYNAFKEKYNVSPADFIKSIRLNNVREELYRNSNNQVSISDIAGKYHFWHLSQFSQDFKKQFGVLPSEIRKN